MEKLYILGDTIFDIELVFPPVPKLTFKNVFADSHKEVIEPEQLEARRESTRLISSLNKDTQESLDQLELENPFTSIFEILEIFKCPPPLR